MSIRPSSVPSSRWSRGSKSNLGQLAHLASTTASSSAIPSGASGSGRLGRPAASVEVGLDPLELGLALLDPPLQPGDRRHQLGRVLAALLGLADLLGDRLALGLGALDPRQQLAATGVEVEQLVDLRGGAAAGERLLDPLGV